MADALGCDGSFEIDRPPDVDPDVLVFAASAAEVGTCVLADSRVMLRVTHAAGADDEPGADFEAFWCLGEPTDSSDHHYAEGRRWIAMPADPGDAEQAATLAELLGGRVASFGCAE